MTGSGTPVGGAPAAAGSVPVVSIVGKSDSGKTGVMEGLIGELAARGYRVATVKHHACGSDLDVPGKDSWRHAKAGAAVSMVSSADTLSVVRRVDRERTLDELAVEAGEVDIVLTEGFKREGRVRIEVSRDARSRELVCALDELFAVVTDGLREVGDVPVFALDDAASLADAIEAAFLSSTGPAPHVDASGRADVSAPGEA